MTWIKLDDAVPDHDRLIRAGDRASWLWVCGLCWSSRHLADGKLPYDVVPRLAGQEDAYELADRLVEAGLWKRTKIGFTIHNYAKFQRTRAQVDAEREAAKERQRKRRYVTAASRRDSAVTHADVTMPEKRRVETDIPPGDASASPNESAAALVAGYVTDYRQTHNGRDPNSHWRSQAGKAVSNLLAEHEEPHVLAVCLGVIARESKAPTVLNHVVADYHAQQTA